MNEQDTTTAVVDARAKDGEALPAWLMAQRHIAECHTQTMMDELRLCLAISTDDERRKINDHLTAACVEWETGRAKWMAQQARP